MNVVHHNAKIQKQKDSELTPEQVSYIHFQRFLRGGILLLIGLSFLYLICLNSIATRGFVLEKIKENRLVIMKELEQVEIDLAIPLSLYALQSSSRVQDMALIEEKQYLHVKNGQLALNP